MFKTLETLDTQQHGDLRYTGVPGYAHARALSTAPIAINEIAEAARHFPILFPAEGRLLPVALLSLENGRTPFVSAQDEWVADYIPAHIRRYPFMLGTTEAEGRFVVMIDRAAPQFSTDGDEPLFENGAPVAGGVVERARQFLVEFENLLKRTEQLLAPLQEHDVLVQRQFNIQKGDEKKTAVRGFRQVDMDAVSRLDDETLAGWVRSGLMSVIVAHTHSLKNAQRILRMQNDDVAA